MPRRRARGLLAACVVLLCGLALVMTHLTWEVVGTTWLAQRDHARTVRAVERLWEPGAAPVGTASDRSTADEDRELAEGVVAVVRIPRLGRHYAVPAREGTGTDQLERGFGIVPGSAPPGARGNLVLAGHRITHGEPLRDMPDLREGDAVVVETREASFTYVLDTDGDALTVSNSDTWVTGPHPGGESRHDRVLTLITCADLLPTADRLVAFGHLVARRPRR